MAPVNARRSCLSLSPAVTIARGLTNTFSGIEPAGTSGFIVAQILGALAATMLFRWIGDNQMTTR